VRQSSLGFIAAVVLGIIVMQHALAKAADEARDIPRLLVGSYDNQAQVAQGRSEHPPPQHVTITIESTPDPAWELWHVHMDVEQEVADAAGSDISLDAVWAMNLAETPHGLDLVPYTVKASVDAAAVKAAEFDPSQWLALAACALAVKATPSSIVAEVPPSEMCSVENMGLGGKRAFLPSWVRREGDALQAQLMYFGKPWRVDAHRLN
jgi:hypothetical protein